MKLDTHVHTSPGSRCSRMSVTEYLEALKAANIGVACVTNHGDMSDFDDLATMAAGSISLIPGVEISSREGDFLIFSRDFTYLRTLTALQPLPDRQQRPDGTAVVWAHPFAGVPGGLDMSEPYLAGIASRVDGIEVYNGNWPDEAASRKAHGLAARYQLAELGGSDAHDRRHLGCCWTDVPKIKSATELVQAIVSRQTSPGKLK